MIWDVFIRRKRRPGAKAGDEIDLLIGKIERFAPGGYRSEREVYYYNYRLLRPYQGPLRSLLEALASGEESEGDLQPKALDLFPLLKDFYDPRGRLTLQEAVRDEGLKRKMAELFLLFYNRKDVGQAEVESWFGAVLEKCEAEP